MFYRLNILEANNHDLIIWFSKKGGHFHMKRLLIILGVVLLLASLLTFCNRRQEEPPAPEVSSESKSPSKAKGQTTPEADDKKPRKIEQKVNDDVATEEDEVNLKEASVEKPKLDRQKVDVKEENDGSISRNLAEPEPQREQLAVPEEPGEWSDFESVSAEVLKETSAGP